MRRALTFVEILITVSLIAIMLLIAVANLRGNKKGVTAPPGSFAEPSASVTDLGSSDSWHLYKLTVAGQSQYVWWTSGSATVVVVPQPAAEAKP